jgi:hypothetical protein
VPLPSLATAVDLGGKKGGAPPASRSNSSLLDEAAWAMNALAGDPRANSHYIQLHKEEVANVFLRMNTTAPCSCGLIFKNCIYYDSRTRHVCSLPGAVVQLLSQSPHLLAPGELNPLAQGFFTPPPLPPFD